jgi:hypothetical protein
MTIKKEKTLKYKLFNAAERDYWRNLHVNVDAICERWAEVYSKELDKYLKLFSEAELIQLLKTYKIKKETSESYVKCLIRHPQKGIEFYCTVRFALMDPKALSEIFTIPIIGGQVNKRAVILQCIKVQEKKALLEVFLFVEKKKLGTGFYKYDFNGEIKSTDFKTFSKALELLCRHLKRYDKENKTYHYRTSFKTDEEWIFLLLKESSDSILPAIPDNVRVLRGDYIVVTIKLVSKSLEINTSSKAEAYKIKEYLSRKTKNKLQYVKKSAISNPAAFFSELEAELNKNGELILTNIDFKKTNMDSGVIIYDNLQKNDVFTTLKTYKEKDMIKLVDYSELKSLHITYKGISYKINVEENQWGQFRFNFVDRGKPKPDAVAFKEAFEKKFLVPLNIYLRNEDIQVDKAKLARKILDKTTIEANLPEDAENILLELIESKILIKPTKTSKRRCEECHKISWLKGDCRECGNDLFIDGNYVDLTVNLKGANNFVYNLIQETSLFFVRKTRKQINTAKYDLIDIMDKGGNTASLYVCSSIVPPKIISHFQETGSPLIIILVKFKDALANDMEALGFQCRDIAGLFAAKENISGMGGGFQTLIDRLKHTWQNRISEKGYASYESLMNIGNEYTDQKFEKDVYNIFHELFLIGDRLGGKFAGIPAPDGIISIQDHSQPAKRFCVAWDCKYSVTKKGYQLTDPPTKHRRYINTLKKNDKVLFYGGLQTYAIISQNMDMKKYKAFVKKLSEGHRWRGNVLFISDKQILSLYKAYKDNEEVIKDNPQIFYSRIYELFRTIPIKDSVPYKIISKERFLEMLEDLEAEFKLNSINFTFERSEFL